jgi:hypothetical protein
MGDEQRADYWLDQARQTRLHAQAAYDPKARETFLRIAGTYERLAHALEHEVRQLVLRVVHSASAGRR